MGPFSIGEWEAESSRGDVSSLSRNSTASFEPGSTHAPEQGSIDRKSLPNLSSAPENAGEAVGGEGVCLSYQPKTLVEEDQKSTVQPAANSETRQGA